jgi:hypothetical protein
MAAKQFFAFGFGYVAAELARKLAADGWTCAGTVRSETSAEPLAAQGFTAHIWPGAEIVPPTGAAWLISVPPDENGCPVFRSFGPLAQTASWIGYLSTTGVYGDLAGGWAFEETPPTRKAAKPRTAPPPNPSGARTAPASSASPASTAPAAPNSNAFANPAPDASSNPANSSPAPTLQTSPPPSISPSQTPPPAPSTSATTNPPPPTKSSPTPPNSSASTHRPPSTSKTPTSPLQPSASTPNANASRTPGQKPRLDGG